MERKSVLPSLLVLLGIACGGFSLVSSAQRELPLPARVLIFYGVSCATFDSRTDAWTVALGTSGGQAEFLSLLDASATSTETTGFALDVAGREGVVTALAFAGDGKTVACGFTESIVVWDVHDVPVSAGPVQTLSAGCGGSYVSSIALSPGLGGNLLASARTYPIGCYYSGSSGVAVWDMNASEYLGVQLDNITDAVSVAFSPDGKMLAAGLSDGRVLWWNASSSSLEFRAAVPTPSEGRGNIVLFSPRGRRFFTASASGLITSRSVDTPSQWVGRSEGAALTALSVSPDGRVLAVGLSNGSLALLDSTTLDQQFFLPYAHCQDVIGLSFSADGERLASVGAEGQVKVWRVLDLKS